MQPVALYTDPHGPYPKLCEAWDVTRDARLYAGPAPVVAHPPCGPYSKQRHNYRGTEHDCAPRALEQVRAFGGVLEHPAESMFWDLAGLPKPYPRHKPGTMQYSETDAHGSFSISCEQVEWGHVARKPTWLYIVGADWLEVARLYDARPYPGRAPTHWCSGNRNNKGGGSVPTGIKVCSAQQRRKTPPAFAQFLLAIAALTTRDSHQRASR
ncbi:MAG TPA: hypothetical protein VL494_13440 [Steroidobacteraceae bacterium]|jgi:hypothetical protein|nr:hypothetical protein [Steroidobacteraceae bacterium]